MHIWKELEASDGHRFKVYHAIPEGSPRGGLVLLQEIFGVNSHIRGMAERYAVEGFEVLAPALFDRVEREVDLDYAPESLQKGIALVTGLGPGNQGTVQDVSAAVADLHGRGNKVGVLGYCWGGSLSWMAAGRLPIACGVGYYGGRIPTMLDLAPQCPVMLHFGELDSHIPLSDADAIGARYPDVKIHIYPADHGFNCEQRASYHPASAQLAWDRSLSFLNQAIASA